MEVLASLGVGLANILLYAGGLAVWPIHRVARRGREPLRAFFILFVVHLGAIAAWTALEIRWALGGGDWLSGLAGYAGINVLFLLAYAVAWWRRRERAPGPA